MTKTKKYICDTNIFVSAVLSFNSLPAKIIEDILNKNIFFAFSDETYHELVEVFNRKKFDKYISVEKRDLFIDKIYNSSQNYTINEKVALCRDPKDNKFLDLALASNAEFLITGDEDLLVLKNIGKTEIITPREFIERTK